MIKLFSSGWMSRTALAFAVVALVLTVTLQWRQHSRPASLGDALSAAFNDSLQGGRGPRLFLVLQPTDCRTNLRVIRSLNLLRLSNNRSDSIVADNGIRAVVVNAPDTDLQRSDLLMISRIEFPTAFVGPGKSGEVLRRIHEVGWSQTPILIGLDEARKVRFIANAGVLDSLRLAPLLGLLGGS